MTRLLSVAFYGSLAFLDLHMALQLSVTFNGSPAFYSFSRLSVALLLSGAI